MIAMNISFNAAEQPQDRAAIQADIGELLSRALLEVSKLREIHDDIELLSDRLSFLVSQSDSAQPA